MNMCVLGGVLTEKTGRVRVAECMKELLKQLGQCTKMIFDQMFVFAYRVTIVTT